MELFVVNRYEEDTGIKISETQSEQEKLTTLLKKINEKRLRRKQKIADQKLQTAVAIERTKENRKRKREKLAKHIVVPENTFDDFIDPNLKEFNGFNTQEDIKDENKTGRNVDLIPSVEGFTVLGVDSFVKKGKVKRVLPKWLANPRIISVDLQNLHTKVSEIKSLDKTIRKLLKSNKIKSFFPVQAEVIPWLLDKNKHTDIMFPRDICVSAPTGSGKTLAFVLPIIQMLKKYNVKKIRALVLLPTQDLARQVFKTFQTYSVGTGLHSLLLTPQKSFEMEQNQLVEKNEIFGYLNKIDILVCTAGRLVDHIKLTEGLDLSHLEFLVIDEADRVLDSVQNDWLHHLEKKIPNLGPGKVLNLFTLQGPKPPQKLLFSATLSQDPEKLQQLSLFQPKLFTSVVVTGGENAADEINADTSIGKYTTPYELTEKYIESSVDLKPLVLFKFIKEENMRKTLIFTHSVESTHRLAILLREMFKESMSIEEISSHLQPKNREELMRNFSDGKIDLLICTDNLARGIDLPGVQCVVSYSAPRYLKTYIHRAGRTARAGETGLAVTILHTSQLPKFRALLKQADKDNVQELKISKEELESLADKYRESLSKLKETIEKEEKTDLRKTKLAKRRKLRKNNKQEGTTKLRPGFGTCYEKTESCP